MRKRRTNLVLGTFIVGWMAVACTAGTGPFGVLDDPYDRPTDSRDRPPDSRDTPPSSRDNPPDSRERPPPSQDNPGSQGGGAGGGGSSCPPCDGKFKCTASSGGQSDTSSLYLKTINGVCAIVDSKGKQKDGVFACGGAIVSGDPKVQASWQSTGPDSFNATVTQTEGNQSLTVTVSCTRDNSSTASPTTTTTAPTPTPTPTGTTKPPTTFDAGIIDSGIKDTGIKG